MISAEIVVKFKATNLVTQNDLDNFDGEGQSITLEEYVRIMVEDEDMLMDIIDDYVKAKVVSVKEIK